jgi:hypothetical protein
MTDYRFWSDTNQREFERALEQRRAVYIVDGFVVSTELEHDQLAADWGGTREDDEWTGSSGLPGSGFDDMGAFSQRSDAAKQPPGESQPITNVFGPPKVTRRTTRSQP